MFNPLNFFKKRFNPSRSVVYVSGDANLMKSLVFSDDPFTNLTALSAYQDCSTVATALDMIVKPISDMTPVLLDKNNERIENGAKPHSLFFKLVISC